MDFHLAKSLWSYSQIFIKRGSVPVVPDLNVPVSYYFQPSTAPAFESPPPRALSVAEIIAPFPNISTFRLAYWLSTNGNQKSQAERAQLVSDVILAPDFSPEHFRGENLAALVHALVNLDSAIPSDSNPFPSSDGWHSRDLTIRVPRSNRSGACARSQVTSVSDSYNEYGDQISIPGLRTRSLISVIRAHFSSANSDALGPLHYIPYQHYWLREDGAARE